jgi:hypothetical protein
VRVRKRADLLDIEELIFRNKMRADTLFEYVRMAWKREFYFIFSNSYESLVGVGPLAKDGWGWTDVGYEKSTIWGMGRYYDESIMSV